MTGLEEGPQEFLHLLTKATCKIFHINTECSRLVLSVTGLALLGAALRGENSVVNREGVIRCLKESVSILTKLNAAGKRELSLGTTLLQEFNFCPQLFGVCFSKASHYFYLCEAYIKTGKLDEALVTAKMLWDSAKNLPAGNYKKLISEFQIVQWKINFSTLFFNRSCFALYTVLKFQRKV